MKILALDLGKFNTMCCFFDSDSRKHSLLNAATERNYLASIFQEHKVDLVVMEACGPFGLDPRSCLQLWPQDSRLFHQTLSNLWIRIAY